MPVDWFFPLLAVAAIATIAVAVYLRRGRTWVYALTTEAFLLAVFWFAYIRPGQILRAAALGGDTNAMFRLSVYYQSRLGYLYPDNFSALYWLVAAASREHPQAMTDLAGLYLTGDPANGIPKDLAKAKNLYLRAAALGNHDAAYILETHEAFRAEIPN